MKQKTEKIPIESLLEQINEQFENIAEIYIAHLPTVYSVSELRITIHTGEAEDYEQYPEISSADEVVVDIGDKESISVPFRVMATYSGPGHIQGNEGTTVFMADNVIGAKSRELDDGISMLRQKLTGLCPSCGDYVDNIGKHYRSNRSCHDAELV